MGISIEGFVSTKLGLASHQNAVPLLRQLTIVNGGVEGHDDLVLELEPSLPFAAAKTWRIDRLGPDSSMAIPDRDIELKEGYLADLTESMQASVHLRLRSSTVVLAEQRFPIKLLARNQWGGAGSMPELLAAFCMPNDPTIDKVLKSTSDVLRRAGRPDGIDGYRAGSRQRVWELASAVWSAVCGYQISYALPPASFEQEGQKIRPPSQVLDGSVGTCLDTALLFAAALEQAGLNPVLLLTKDHAFTGVWLQPQEFSQVLNEDASSVRKRIELQELLVFETTLATQSPAPGFSHAVDIAKRQLSDEDFVMAVDVRRARMQKLRPLTVAAKSFGESHDEQAPKVSEALESAPELPAFDIEVEEEPSTAADKLELWQRKLLDLTTRNRLLHLPESAKVIRLTCPDPAGLEDILAANKSVRIVHTPDLEVGGRDSEIYEKRNRENLEEEAARQAMARNEVLSRMEKGKLEAALIDLYRKARSDLEEGGSNTLFLAIGFLHWKKAEDDPKSYCAPLILLPVKLERRSVLSGVKMSMLDDEPRFNLTLLELLRHDFQLNIPGLSGDLPTDESGINVEQIWNIVRRAVRDMPGFEVTTDVALGTFSFSKYLMWRDLIDRSEQLMQNDVVRHLLQHKMGGSSLESLGEFPEPKKLDATVKPGELFTPLPADSSQLAAVVASATDHSFVLDGPPGTGKSQTIANMIAHNLALGRRVLFVAEKMAALDVVKRRLEDRGIGQFCLELHSSKSSKMHVLQQLDRAWTSRDTLTEAEWNAQAEKVRSLRDRLNEVVQALHERWSNGWSIHEAIGRVVKDATPMTPRLSWPEGTEHDAAQMGHFRDIARRLDLNRAAAEGARARMTLVIRTEWSNAWQEAMVGAARQVLGTLKACDEACAQVLQHTGLSVGGSTPVAAKLLGFVRRLPDAHDVDLRFAFSPALKTIRAAAQQVASLLKDYEALETRLSQSYASEAVRRIDVDRLRGEWTQASGKFWFLATLAKKRVSKALAETAGTSAPPNVEADLALLAAMKAIVAKIDAMDRDLQDVPGWSALSTNVTRMAFATNLAESLRASLIPLASSPEQLVTLRHETQKLVVDGNGLLAPNGPIAEAIGELTSRYKALFDATELFGKAAGSEVDLNKQVPELFANAQAVSESEKTLNAWCSWRRVRQEAIDCGMQPLVEAVEQGTLPDGSVAHTFEVAYARWFASKAIDAEPLLCHFVPAEHQSDIDAYTKAVDQLGELTSAYIRAKLSGNIPDKNDVTKRSGFGILKHELQKQRSHKPVRQLAKEMGQDFTVLAPCMLMSPLSIAQYLPADHALFDLVIFDEASQIAPWDAVGSIARGKKVVIAGDPRQMPPTSFFNRGTGASDDDTDEDLESILDECIGAGVRQHSLTWHYRSRHESLITFSNYRYYGGSLITFPAADTRPSAVSWRKVDGIYAQGKGGRRNQIEAKAIVAEVVKRLIDPQFIASGQSIGIITLNAEQQQLVDDLLDQARREHREIEPFFKDDLAEPVVVKNLETMQGDERDLIILGIGFGPTVPDANVMSMNFGPLNREGGWRRLNVAVTRARREMVVFTSFDPSMIDLNRTSARAVHDLRHFIEFAHQGPKAITAVVRGSVGDYDSPFEQFVAEGLRAKGWETHPQIGVSRFRIDLGVVHPDRPGDYLIGVECDGATYHSAATARDRDKVRSEILRSLGWRLVRVWSTAWWVDRDGALERLHEAISAELEDQRAKAVELHRAREIEAAAAAKAMDAEGAAIVERDTEQDDEAGEMPASDPMVVKKMESPPPEPMHLVARGPSDDRAAPIERTYRMADLSRLESSLKPDSFHDASYDAILETCIREVLEQEAPILDKVLVDRIARAHGFKRSGRLIRERVLELAERHYHFQPDSELDHGHFVWLAADDPVRWNIYRVPEQEEDIRFIEELAPEEIVAIARSIQSDDPVVDIARAFGIRRLSASAKGRLVRVLGAYATR
jgi:very-short-patch-repair endonuclease